MLLPFNRHFDCPYRDGRLSHQEFNLKLSDKLVTKGMTTVLELARVRVELKANE